MSNNKSPIGKVFSGILGILLAAFMFGGANSLKNEWTYSFDSEAQEQHTILILLAFVFLGLGFYWFLSAVITADSNTPSSSSSMKENNNIKPETKDAEEAENINTNVIKADMKECIFCGEEIEKNQIRCTHCKRRQD